ncbi:hypothetical protein KVR01_005613 [Diaporthe batatas]|uniref:uncharacterized protein n=1 Tax=Diaporthe batatas TaxID=748121 RepID=UPI001D036923|nr:uncharacterized protein KVR01_005613 [Diaporthe batatas]KAG8165338.1 hypothetical protein KVR01_005613 [Diaporthe batatas]
MMPTGMLPMRSRRCCVRAAVSPASCSSCPLSRGTTALPGLNYVAYSCAHIYAQRHVTPQGPDEKVPQGFKELRQGVLNYSSSSEGDEGLMGLFIVITEARPGPTPPELQERWQTLIPCGLCEQTFQMWSTRQGHRNEVHGLDEELDALPSNA